MADLTRTSFYGDGRQEALKGPKGDKGDEGPQGPSGPQLPLPIFPDNASAIAAGRELGSLYARQSGQVYIVI